MNIAVSRQLGGTSNLWGGICLRFDPIDFIPRPGLVDARWPITYEELLPFYDRALWYARSGEPVSSCQSQTLRLTMTRSVFIR